MTAIITIGGIHLANSTGAPVAGGVATAAATTPFAIRRGWHPLPAEPPEDYNGGAPYQGYPRVTESVPFVVVGTTHENAVARLQELKRALMPLDGFPPQLVIQPTASSIAVQSEIYRAVVREVTEEGSGFEGWEGFSTIEAEITWTRAPFLGHSDFEAAVALVSSATVTNTGTGANPNIQAYAASIAGDLSHEGQPVNVTFTPSGAGIFTTFYFATIYSRTYSTTGAGALTTSSTTGVVTALNTPQVYQAEFRRGLHARVLFRLSNATANVQIKVEMRAIGSGTILFSGAWVTPTTASATLYDMGQIPLDLFLQAGAPSTTTAQLYIRYRSTDGLSATATLGYNEFLLYYTFCRVDSPTAINSAGIAKILGVRRFREASIGRALLPIPQIAVANTNVALDIADVASIRGQAPLAIEGASLYLAWMAAGNVHDTTKTGTLTVTHAPLWRTLRGSQT